jgi:hypothetical protein
MNKEIELKPCPLEPCPPESGALDFIEWHSKYLRLQAENVRLQELIGMATEHLARIHLRSAEQGVKDIADNALEQLMPDDEVALQHNES